MFVPLTGPLSRNLINICLRSPSVRLNSMSTPSKMAKVVPTIGTHNSTFHCDDVTACYMLKTLDRFKDHEIVRTRDPDLLAQAEIVVDVGGELDVERLRLDHHQRSFNQTIKDYHPNIKTTNPNKPPRLSSAGLVFAVFGKDYIVKQLSLGNTFNDIKDDAEKVKMIDAIFDKAYIEFMEEIDAIDNGVEIVDGDNVQYNYHIKSGISNRVGRYNPIDTNASDEERLDQFKRAMEMVGAEMSEGIKYLGTVWWPKRQLFRDCILRRKDFDPCGQIVFIDCDYLVGWKSAIYDFEEELGIVGEIKYVVYRDPTGGWRVTGVPVELNSFHTRVPLKEEWRGKRDDDLQSVSGVPDATFVHMSGFTGGAKSRDGIKAMVYKSLGL
uniref:UPF0160 protein C27H6.8 n=1 Tax=Aceria tosichella TaxID=561515 RepID=A0A6G1SL22_9ACAR